MVPSFKNRLQAVNPKYETFENLQTLQVNLGNLCNLYCTHCHVAASSRGTEIMGTDVMDQIAGVLTRHPGLTLDITGGCPEMNPNFLYHVGCCGAISRSWLNRGGNGCLSFAGTMT